MPAGTGLRNTAGRLGWKIDTRGHGGFVVAAGSLRGDGRYRITRHREIAPLPAWLTRALTPATPDPAAPPDQPGQRPRDLPRNRRTYLQAILDGETDAVAAAQPGTRHSTLLAAACTLGRLIADGELDEHLARRALHHAAARHVGINGIRRTPARRSPCGEAHTPGPGDRRPAAMWRPRAACRATSGRWELHGGLAARKCTGSAVPRR